MFCDEVIVRRNDCDEVSGHHHNITTDSNLEQFCKYILPQIHFNVKYSAIESELLKPFLLATDYPNLAELKISNFQRDTSLRYLTDDSPLQHVFKKQITKLEIIIKDEDHEVESREIYTKHVYAHILTYFENLKDLNIVDVSCLTDCVCLLDGRLKQLNTFIVQVTSIDMNSSLVDNMNDLPNLKCLSFSCYHFPDEYDQRFVTTIRRMFNLEKLTLNVSTSCQTLFIDPIHLLNEFTMHLWRLNLFKFYLKVTYKKEDLVQYLTKNDIKHNYKTIGCQEVSDMVSFTVNTDIYHIFTLPFEFELLSGMGNMFPNIIFANVTTLWIWDVVLIKHEFFLRIARPFPSLDCFRITALETYSCNALELFELVEYPHPVTLHIEKADVIYVEELLNEKRTRLPCLSTLYVFYEPLRIVTNDFTREETRHNCVNVRKLTIGRDIVGSKDFYTYFPIL